MRVRHAMLFAALAAGCMAGCSAGLDSAPQTAATASVTAPASASESPSTEFSEPLLPDSFSLPPMTDHQRRLHAWMMAINEFDPYLSAGDPVQALDNAEELCGEMRDKTDAEAAEIAAQLFKTDGAKAAGVVVITKSKLCPQP